MHSSLRLLRTLADQRQYVELRELSQSVWHETQAPAVLPLLALAQGQLGEATLSQQTLEQALLRQSEFDAEALVDTAAVLIVLQQIDAAVAMLEAVLSQCPDHALGLARLGYCRLVQDDVEIAQPLFQQSIELQPKRIDVLLHLAHSHLQQSQLGAGQQVLDQAFALLAEIGVDLPEELVRQHYYQLNGLQCRIWVEGQHFEFAELWLQEQAESLGQERLSEADFIHYLCLYTQLLAERDLHDQAMDILREYFKQHPHNLVLHRQLAELCQIRGHFIQALKLLRRALKLDGDNVGLWVRLVHVSLQCSDKGARQAAQRAVELAESRERDEQLSAAQIKMQQAQARSALAQVESHEQNFDLAETLFREVLAEQSNCIPALQGLAQQQMQSGQIDEAIELFERIKQLDPVAGHAALINARRFPEDVAILDKIEQAAQVPSLEGPLRSTLLFRLAAAWEKRGEYGRAFGFAGQANRTSKKFLPYDAKAHRERCARIRFGFSAELYERRAGYGVDSSLPVYVLGMPRSGTTLVEQIVAGHSEIFGAGELALVGQVVQGLNRWERHVGSGRSYPDSMDDLTAKVSAGIATNLLQEMQELAPDARHVVDKMPHNFQHIGLIKFLFPRAKIISVRRDPRDIAISNYFTDYQSKHGGMGFAYELDDIGEQLADHSLLMQHWHKLFPGEILEVNYEDVVDDLEVQARRMIDFIGVDWEPQVLNFNQLDRNVKTASVWQVRQPIYKSSKARWTNYRDYLAPLIAGTNRKIESSPIEMLSLPHAGFLVDGVDQFREGDWDAAELSFKKMLHHNPGHAACGYMVGLVYLHRGHIREGIAQIEPALEQAPWQKSWRDNLVKAYRLLGEDDKAQQLEVAVGRRQERGLALAGEGITALDDQPQWADEAFELG